MNQRHIEVTYKLDLQIIGKKHRHCREVIEPSYKERQLGILPGDLEVMTLDSAADFDLPSAMKHPHFRTLITLWKGRQYWFYFSPAPVTDRWVVPAAETVMDYRVYEYRMNTKYPTSPYRSGKRARAIWEAQKLAHATAKRSWMSDETYYVIYEIRAKQLDRQHYAISSWEDMGMRYIAKDYKSGPGKQPDGLEVQHRTNPEHEPYILSDTTNYNLITVYNGWQTMRFASFYRDSEIAQLRERFPLWPPGWNVIHIPAGTDIRGRYNYPRIGWGSKNRDASPLDWLKEWPSVAYRGGLITMEKAREKGIVPAGAPVASWDTQPAIEAS